MMQLINLTLRQDLDAISLTNHATLYNNIFWYLKNIILSMIKLFI